MPSLLSLLSKDAPISVRWWKQKLLIVSEQTLPSVFLKDILVRREFEGGIRLLLDKMPTLCIIERTVEVFDIS